MFRLVRLSVVPPYFYDSNEAGQNFKSIVYSRSLLHFYRPAYCQVNDGSVDELTEA